MWRVVVARSDDNSTLLSSEISTGTMGPSGHLSTLSGPPASHHWGYPPPPHHPTYQTPQHPDMRHHHDMRNTDPRIPNPSELRPELRHPDIQRAELRHPEMQRHPEMIRSELRHDMQRPQDIRHQEMQRPQDIRHQDMSGMRPDLTELRPSHELPELKIDGTELRTQDNQQAQQHSQSQGHQRNLKRTLSDSDCDDVFSEESGKEP